MRDVVTFGNPAKVLDVKVSQGNTSAKITAWNIDAEFLAKMLSANEVMFC